MKPTIKSILKRMGKARETFESARYELLEHPFNSREICLVELSRPAATNLFSKYEIEIFCKGFMGNFDFETYWIDGETAKYYGIEPGHYLSVSYYL